MLQSLNEAVWSKVFPNIENVTQEEGLYNYEKNVCRYLVTGLLTVKYLFLYLYKNFQRKGAFKPISKRVTKPRQGQKWSGFSVEVWNRYLLWVSITLSWNVPHACHQTGNSRTGHSAKEKFRMKLKRRSFFFFIVVFCTQSTCYIHFA